MSSKFKATLTEYSEMSDSLRVDIFRLDAGYEFERYAAELCFSERTCFIQYTPSGETGVLQYQMPDLSYDAAILAAFARKFQETYAGLHHSCSPADVFALSQDDAIYFSV